MANDETGWLMGALEGELWDVYRFLLRKGASEGTARDALLSIARDKMPEADEHAITEAASRVLAHFRPEQSVMSERSPSPGGQ